MTDLNYYDPLTTVNESEQKTLGSMRKDFSNAIGSAGTSQDTMISSYISANASRQTCYTECPKELLSKQEKSSNTKTCIPVERIREMSGDNTKTPWGTTKNRDYETWVENCAGMDGSDCDGGGRCEMRAPTNPNCVPDERVTKMKGTSRNKDYTVWALQCGTLGEQKCESTTMPLNSITLPAETICDRRPGFPNQCSNCPYGSVRKGLNDWCCREDEKCEKSVGERCKKIPSNLKCIPEKRIREMSGTSRNKDYEVWLDRCNNLSNDKCDSINEWPNGSGGRCENLLKLDVNSCKAGCDLKWPGIVQNAAGTQGVDGSQTIGRYIDTNGKKNDITQCSDVSKYSPEGFTGKGGVVAACQDAGTKTKSAVPNATSCRGWKCDTDGQFCPASQPGSSGTGFCCRSGKWVSGICPDVVAKNSAVEPTGDFLIKNRRKEKTAFSKLQSMQEQVKNSINQMQSKNLNVNSLYKTKNTDLLKQLASYEQASHKLLKTGANLDTLGAQQSDSLLRKNSVDMSYYLWLTLAISILGIAITKIK